MLASLARRGVELLQVAEEVPLSQEELAAQREEIAVRLDFLFRHGEGQLMAALHETVLAYRLAGLR